MTIPLDNLYDYIFSLTGHTNKNLIMYRFDPHGSKDLRNLIVHNKVEHIMIKLSSTNREVLSNHYKVLICHDQEPLAFDLYTNDLESRKKIFYKISGKVNDMNNSFGQKMSLRKNIAGHPLVPPTLYDSTILLHSEKKSSDLEKYEQNNFIGAYYWSHAFIALDWYRFAKYDTTLNYKFKSCFDKDFNIYCRAWTGSRKYRLKFLSFLKNHKIDKQSSIFFNEYDNNIHFSKYTTNQKIWTIDTEEKNNIKKLECVKGKNNSSELSAVYSANDYQKSAIDVVLETVFDKNKIQLTEKTLRPIACGKPFLLISEKGSLEYLKSYGFKTFENLIDESYDQIEDPIQRMKSVIEVMKDISNLDISSKFNLFYEMHEIADENKKWFFSDEFFNVINNELKQNLNVALKKLDNPEYQTGSQLHFSHRAYCLYEPYLHGHAKKLAERYILEVPEIIELSKKNIGKY